MRFTVLRTSPSCASELNVVLKLLSHTCFLHRYLHNNRITSLASESFSGLTKLPFCSFVMFLSFLNLTPGRLSFVLSCRYLHSNLLRVISSQAFFGLGSLRELYVVHLSWTYTNAHVAFASFRHLHNNALTLVGNDTFVGLGALTYLYVLSSSMRNVISDYQCWPTRVQKSLQQLCQLDCKRILLPHARLSYAVRLCLCSPSMT
jgi:hypothetical protein